MCQSVCENVVGSIAASRSSFVLDMQSIPGEDEANIWGTSHGTPLTNRPRPKDLNNLVRRDTSGQFGFRNGLGTREA